MCIWKSVWGLICWEKDTRKTWRRSWGLIRKPSSVWRFGGLENILVKMIQDNLVQAELEHIIFIRRWVSGEIPGVSRWLELEMDQIHHDWLMNQMDGWRMDRSWIWFRSLIRSRRLFFPLINSKPEWRNCWPFDLAWKHCEGQGHVQESFFTYMT